MRVNCSVSCLMRRTKPGRHSIFRTMRSLPAALLLSNYLIFPLGLLVAACQQQAETATQPTAAQQQSVDSVGIAAPLLGARLSPILSGYWLSSAYLQKLARTRSPATAFSYLPNGPASIYIEPFASQTDSFHIGASYGMHEGGEFTLLLPPAIAANTIPLKQQYGDQPGTAKELVYQISSRDTTLSFVERQAKGKRITTTIAYQRVVPSGIKTDLNGGVEWGVNQLLMVGRYRGADSLQHAVSAQFLPNGTVKGLPFRKYLIQVDFTGPHGGDEVIFDVYTRAQLKMAASFGCDTLRLYSMHTFIEALPGTTDTTEVFRRGRLRYELIRQR
jgi:hypothetical protein